MGGWAGWRPQRGARARPQRPKPKAMEELLEEGEGLLQELQGLAGVIRGAGQDRPMNLV